MQRVRNQGPLRPPCIMPALSLGDWAFIFIIVTVIACAGCCLVMWKLAYADGYHAGKAAEQSRQAERRLRDAARARAARETLPRSPVREPWYVVIEKRTMRIPVPPGPARYGSLITDTGEFRAVAKAGTDLYIEDMQREGNAYRAKITEQLRA
jgi:hypothetical protein